ASWHSGGGCAAAASGMTAPASRLPDIGCMPASRAEAPPAPLAPAPTAASPAAALPLLPAPATTLPLRPPSCAAACAPAFAGLLDVPAFPEVILRSGLADGPASIFFEPLEQLAVSHATTAMKAKTERLIRVIPYSR